MVSKLNFPFGKSSELQRRTYIPDDIVDNIINNIMEKKMAEAILKILEKNSKNGLTITDIVNLSKFSRSAVRTILAQLEGANQVSMRNIGMAKLYSFKKEAQELNENSHSADSSI